MPVPKIAQERLTIEFEENEWVRKDKPPQTPNRIGKLGVCNRVISSRLGSFYCVR
jgi:hypothetical protein